VTSTLDRPSLGPSDSGPGHTSARSVHRSGPWLSRALRSRGIRLPAHWPFTALVAFFPIWWALGLGSFAIIGFSLPMALQLRRARPLRVPRGFAFWLCFLAAVLVSGLMLGKTAPDTLPHAATSQLVAYVLRFVNYIAATVLLLYVVNMRGRGLTDRRIVGCLATFFIVAVAGGLLGLAAPGFSFTSPFEWLLPQTLADNGYVRVLVHPAAAQNQDVLGFTAPRPKAPFEYTNTWGNVIGLLIVWFTVWAVRARGRGRVFAVIMLCIALVPIVNSLNRGLWVGVGLGLLLLAVRLAMSGKLATVIGLAAAVSTLAVVVMASPLATVVQERLNHGHSNDIRSNLAEAAFKGAAESPVIGWGTTREVRGSYQSIAVGTTSGCARCGNADIGSTGHFWLTIFAQGFVGEALYLGFFLSVLWFYRGQRTAIGIGAQITIIMSLWFMFVYSAVGWPLALQMIAVGVLWRQKQPQPA
jgi:polysaccharide biosynthesis protein PslJ